MRATSQQVEITFSAENSDDLNAIRDPTKEDDVIAARETAAGTVSARLPLFPDFGILGE